MASGCTHEEASFVSLDDLDNVSILLDDDNDLEEEITHLFNEVFLFSSGDIQLLCHHKMTKIWTPPPLPLPPMFALV